MKVLPLPEWLKERTQFGFFDDFLWYISPHLWTTYTTSVGGESVAWNANAGGTGRGGFVLLTTGGTQDNEAAISTTNALFVCAQDKPLVYETIIQYTDADTNNAAIFAGFADTMGATGMIQAGELLIKASFTGFGLFKPAGTTLWSIVSSVTTTQQVTPTNVATITGTQTLRVEVQPISSTQVEATFYINDVAVVDSNNFRLKHTVTFGTTAMKSGVFAKAGSAHSQTVYVDYVGSAQYR